MVEVFVEQVTERLIYTLDFIFNEREIQYKITNDQLLFSKSTNIKFNYSTVDFKDVFSITPCGLVHDEKIVSYDVTLHQLNNIEYLAFNQHDDILASVFYVLSRFEEYETGHEDIHGRFLSKYSLQKKYNWLEVPVCDKWAVLLINNISDYYNITIDFNIGKVSILPSFDIDNTTAYLWKNGIRKYLSIFRDKVKRDKKRVRQRKLVLEGIEKDPYDTFDYIKNISDRGFKVNMFWLLGDYASFDKNLSHNDIRHQELILEMSQKCLIGIHPSYKSNSFRNQIEIEQKRLEFVLDSPIRRSRQHYLRFNVGRTYAILLSLGIKHEFSMGFSDHIGFRSGTARPHFWFDLNRNTITKLLIHPFVYMDGTLNEQMELTVEESLKKIDHLYSNVSQYGGDFMFIWHNETIGGYGKWENWNQVLEYSLNLRR